MKKILILLATFSYFIIAPAHAVSVTSWELTDFNGDGFMSDFRFNAAPTGNSSLKFGPPSETGCTNAPDGINCVPIITDGRTYPVNAFTTGFNFLGTPTGYFKPNLEITGGIVADITNNTLTFAALNWAGRFPEPTPTSVQFFIPPNDILEVLDPITGDPTGATTGSINTSLVNVQTLTDLGDGRYGVVVRWSGRILDESGNLAPAYTSFTGHWRVEGIMTTVPVPGAVWLLGSGLLGLLGIARRKRHQD